ncbi:MAG TPA: hypothetical protein DDY13_04970 [Cytophagales bacterium]|jgi:predicted deacylase|nr:hypothetical protein [Cytophagales bacterium]
MITQADIEKLVLLDDPKRLLGKFTGDKGPNVIFFGAIHGNEPAGVIAIQKVLRQLHKKEIPFKGRLIGICGHLEALKQGKRYLAKDLNRIWYGHPEHYITYGDVPEYNEKKEILDQMLEQIDPNEPTILFDLHTTSAKSIPFVSISDTLKNRSLISGLPAPLILGLEEQMDGPMFSFFSELGIPAVLFEAGQHQAGSSVKNSEAFIWMSLIKCGCLEPDHVPNRQEHYRYLRSQYTITQPVFQLKHTYLIAPDENFKMKPGYVNFQRVEAGEVLGYNQNGQVSTPIGGLIFMPLYQSLGKEGFFIIKRVKPVWIRASRNLRQVRADRMFHWFPGVQKAHYLKDGFIINRKKAWRRTLDIFHLMGYRRVQKLGPFFEVSRRPYDKKMPIPQLVYQRLKDYRNSLP